MMFNQILVDLMTVVVNMAVNLLFLKKLDWRDICTTLFGLVLTSTLKEILSQMLTEYLISVFIIPLILKVELSD
ncbi:hypothetical protein [Maribacter sp.]|uniref:hypothetical protein n=1 Tax=Maribacter sp. TaxID=1897614 RepID=UPI0025BFAD00|nr:hypothetical protein [Maribacter sp.]